MTGRRTRKFLTGCALLVAGDMYFWRVVDMAERIMCAPDDMGILLEFIIATGVLLALAMVHKSTEATRR